MSRRIRVVSLTDEQRSELEVGYRTSKNATLSRRCHVVLLKSEPRTSKEVAGIVGLTELSVNHWLDRYESEGISGLQTRSGRGRKPILKTDKDKKIVRRAVQKERQQLKQVKAEIEADLGKTFSESTLKRFLKKLAADGNESV